MAGAPWWRMLRSRRSFSSGRWASAVEVSYYCYCCYPWRCKPWRSEFLRAVVGEMELRSIRTSSEAGTLVSMVDIS
jgi:hypothetical protein